MAADISPLEPPDTHYLSAAQGWLELGNPAEALVELQQIGDGQAAHPAVLELRWQINARTGQWETCLTLATRLVESHPDLPAGWIHRSYALHELQRTEEARDQLLPAVDQFPAEAVLPYNIACYECRLGNLPAAREWLKRTFAVGDGGYWRRNARMDLDLAALWADISKL